MRTYLVESYLPTTRSFAFDDAVARLSAAAPDLPTSEGARYLHSTLVPADEICFHVFEADSIEAVREAGVRASITFDRIVEARGAWSIARVKHR